jgi:hypothetical protein
MIQFSEFNENRVEPLTRGTRSWEPLEGHQQMAVAKKETENTVRSGRRYI